MARGRRQVPYRPSWGGDPIPGLYKCPDGRWRINATGQKFTEHDEARAIEKFYAMTKSDMVALPIAQTKSSGFDDTTLEHFRYPCSV
jgi:hypothetical protein